MAEHHVLGCVLRVRGLIESKSTLVYWGEEKDSGLRPFRKESVSIGRGCVATHRLWLVGVARIRIYPLMNANKR